MKEKAKSLGLTHLDFDGCSEIWVKSWDDWMAFFQVQFEHIKQYIVVTDLIYATQSPEYAKALAPDCQYFMAMPIHVAVGYDNLIYGEALPNMGGNDGVTTSNLQSRS